MKNVTNGINNIGKDRDKRLVDVRMSVKELQAIMEYSRAHLELGLEDATLARIYRDSIDILAKL